MCFLSCWLQDNVTFYVSVVAYAVLVFLFNTAVKPKTFHEVYYYYYYTLLHRYRRNSYMAQLLPCNLISKPCLNFLLGFCGGSDADSPHASQQSSRDT